MAVKTKRIPRREEILDIINIVNNITEDRSYFVGSIEDDILLKGVGKDIRDIDVVVTTEEDLKALCEFYNFLYTKASYYNNFQSLQFDKYVCYDRDIKIDILYPHTDTSSVKLTTSEYYGTQVKHQTYEYKAALVREWVTMSRNDDWVSDKFLPLLNRYE